MTSVVRKLQVYTIITKNSKQTCLPFIDSIIDRTFSFFIYQIKAGTVLQEEFDCADSLVPGSPVQYSLAVIVYIINNRFVYQKIQNALVKPKPRSGMQSRKLTQDCVLIYWEKVIYPQNLKGVLKCEVIIKKYFNHSFNTSIYLSRIIAPIFSGVRIQWILFLTS